MPFVSDLLTATPATVDGNPTPNRTWQWLRGSTPISGATSNTYTVQEADIGETISVRQTETNLLGSASAFSLATAIVTVFDAYAIGGNSPELVASFLTQEDGTTEGEYFRTGGATDDFTMFTFSRASNATMFDSTGTLKWAPHNLMDGSHNFDNASYWYTADISIAAATTNGPDGSTKMWALTDNNASLLAGMLDVGNVFVTGQSIFEIWITKDENETRFPRVVFAPFSTQINTKTGAVHHFGSQDDFEITEAVPGLWRCRWTFTRNGGTDVFIYPAAGNTISTSDANATGTAEFGFISIRRADLPMADNPDQPAGLEKYVPTTSAAVYLPRRNAYYYNGTSWVKGGLQLESAAATNLHATSRGFSSWSGTAGTSRTLNAIGIDGVSNTAATLTNTSGDTHYFFLDTTVAADTSTYVASVCVKKAVSPATYPGIRVQAPALYDYLLDHENGVMVKRGSSSTAPATYVEDLGDYWRFSIQSVNNGVNTLHRVLIFPSVDTDNDDTWAATAPIGSAVFDQTDLVVNAVPTSPIITSGSTVTRPAETLIIAGADNPVSATEFTVAGDVLLTYDGAGPEMLNIQTVGTFARLYPRNIASTYTIVGPGSASEVFSAQGGTVAAGINQTFAFSLGVKAGDFLQLVVNGAAGTKVAKTTLVDFSGTNIDIPGATAEGSYFIRSFRAWSTKLPEADLITAGTAS